MAFLGSKAAHEECGVRIMEYLEHEGGKDRAIAFDCVNLGAPETAKGRWAAMMDATRVLSGCHTDWGGKRCVTYQHFVISPDPRDGVDLETLRDLTMEWVHEFFGDWDKPGKLGSYEVAVVYHDDNEKEIPHAHVIVNNTNLDNARRLHIDNDQNHEIDVRLQEICKERGLRYFDEDDADSRLQEEPRYYTKAERKLIRDGKFSWKQDIANHVVVARRLCTDEKQFMYTCGLYGIDVEQRDGDFLFKHYHNEERWKVTGHRLGRNYERDSILKKLEQNRLEYGDGIDPLRRNISAKLILEAMEHSEVAAVVQRGADVAEVAMTLMVNERYQIRALSEYDARIAYYQELWRSAQTDQKKDGYLHAISDLRRARACASEGDFFSGVSLPRPKSDAYAMRLSEVPRGNRGEASSSGAGRGRSTGREVQPQQRKDISRNAGRSRR